MNAGAHWIRSSIFSSISRQRVSFGTRARTTAATITRAAMRLPSLVVAGSARFLPSRSTATTAPSESSTESAVDMMAASAPMNTTTANIALSVPLAAHSPSSLGITVSAWISPRPPKRGIAARPISVTTSVVVNGMKVIRAKERLRVRPLRAAYTRWSAWG